MPVIDSDNSVYRWVPTYLGIIKFQLFSFVDLEKIGCDWQTYTHERDSIDKLVLFEVPKPFTVAGQALVGQ